MPTHAQDVGEVATLDIGIALERRLEPAGGIPYDATTVIEIVLFVERTVDVRYHAQREIAELIIFAADHRDDVAVWHVVGAREIRRGLVANDHRAGALGDVAGVERMVGVPVGDDDIVGLLDVRIDQRRVGRIRIIRADFRGGPLRRPARELREEGIHEHDLLAVGDLPARVPQIREAELASLERRCGGRAARLGAQCLSGDCHTGERKNGTKKTTHAGLRGLDCAGRCVPLEEKLRERMPERKGTRVLTLGCTKGRRLEATPLRDDHDNQLTALASGSGSTHARWC